MFVDILTSLIRVVITFVVAYRTSHEAFNLFFAFIVAPLASYLPLDRGDVSDFYPDSDLDTSEV